MLRKPENWSSDPHEACDSSLRRQRWDPWGEYASLFCQGEVGFIDKSCVLVRATTAVMKTMTKSNLARKGFIWIIYPEAKAKTQTRQEPVGRS